MTIQKIGKDEFYIECNKCGDEGFLEAEEFREAVDEARGIGWTVRNVDGQWIDLCEYCSEELERI